MAAPLIGWKIKWLISLSLVALGFYAAFSFVDMVREMLEAAARLWPLLALAVTFFIMGKIVKAHALKRQSKADESKQGD
ncbi:hypothetical protein [Halomonas chromatireducens]|uniref:hypothetical protein n=1 Tax=Halomonas chromatireducens TaxID=507626 RepID=UPI00118739B9|nr:hypothetical protein [Halomonas chromatireducens]